MFSSSYLPFIQTEKYQGALAMIPSLPFDRNGKPIASLGVGPLPDTFTIPGLGIKIDVRALKPYLQSQWIAAAVVPAVLAFLYYR